MRTRIELGTSGDIELFEDISTPLNFTIADIRTPETRQGSYSKTISIPGSKQNNKLLGHIFDINIGDCTFNPKIKTPARLYINDIPQLTGYMQLLKIKKLDNYKIEYEVAIFGKSSNIFLEIGDGLLTDLNYNEFDHLYSRDEQEGSWTQDYTYGYVYPLIDYGFDTDINKYDTEHLFPATYVRTYVDKIFEGAGYTYQSSFFDSDLFKKLIIPYNGTNLKLSGAQTEARVFNAYDNTLRTYTGAVTGTNSGGSPVTQLTIANETNDPSNQFNTSTYIATIANSGYYNLYATVEFYLSATSSTTFPAAPTQGYLRVERKPNGSSIWNVINSNSSAAIGFYPASSGDISSTYSIYCGTGNVFLAQGDQLRLRFFTAANGIVGASYDIKVPAVVFENSVINSGLVEGNTIDYNQAIPPNIKQKDFLISLIRMFNLYVDVDKDNDKKLIIEPRDDFYSSGSIKDWTYKLDISRDLEYTPLGDLNFRRSKYTYKKDVDKYNKQYEDTWKEVYGEYVYDNGNEFYTNESKTEIIFSPTPICDDVSSNRVVPRLWKEESNGQIKPSQFNLRILYWGGLLSCNVDWVHTARGAADVSRSTYPYAGHVDNPVTPTLDLSFGVPREIYYYTNQYTNNNLFNRYHKKFIEEITNKDSKVVVGYFHLTPLDILLLDFRDEFYFDNQRFRLNKIYDYNPIVNEITKCEFIKVKESSQFVAETITVNGFGTASGAVVTSPFLGNDVIVRYDNNETQRGDSGSGNTFGSGVKSYLGNGQDNYVHDYSRNVALINSSGDTVYAGLKNVTLINTNDVTVTSGDVAFINGAPIPSMIPLYSPIKTITSNYNLFVYDGTLLCDCTAGNITINLTYTQEQYAKQWVQFTTNGTVITVYFTKIINVKKIDSTANTVTLDPAGSATIDGQLTQVLSTQYDNITIQWDGTNWHIL